MSCDSYLAQFHQVPVFWPFPLQEDLRHTVPRLPWLLGSRSVPPGPSPTTLLTLYWDALPFGLKGMYLCQDSLGLAP